MYTYIYIHLQKPIGFVMFLDQRLQPWRNLKIQIYYIALVATLTNLVNKR